MFQRSYSASASQENLLCCPSQDRFTYGGTTTRIRRHSARQYSATDNLHQQQMQRALELEKYLKTCSLPAERDYKQLERRIVMHRAQAGPPSGKGRAMFTSVMKLDHSGCDGWKATVTVWFRHTNEVLYYVDSAAKVHGPMDQNHSSRIGAVHHTAGPVDGSPYATIFKRGTVTEDQQAVHGDTAIDWLLNRSSTDSGISAGSRYRQRHASESRVYRSDMDRDQYQRDDDYHHRPTFSLGLRRNQNHHHQYNFNYGYSPVDTAPHRRDYHRYHSETRTVPVHHHPQTRQHVQVNQHGGSDFYDTKLAEVERMLREEQNKIRSYSAHRNQHQDEVIEHREHEQHHHQHHHPPAQPPAQPQPQVQQHVRQQNTEKTYTTRTVTEQPAEVYEEIETITLQPIGKGVQDLEPAHHTHRAVTMSTPHLPSAVGGSLGRQPIHSQQSYRVDTHTLPAQHHTHHINSITSTLPAHYRTNHPQYSTSSTSTVPRASPQKPKLVQQQPLLQVAPKVPAHSASYQQEQQVFNFNTIPATPKQEPSFSQHQIYTSLPDIHAATVPSQVSPKLPAAATLRASTPQPVNMSHSGRQQSAGPMNSSTTVAQVHHPPQSPPQQQVYHHEQVFQQTTSPISVRRHNSAYEHQEVVGGHDAPPFPTTNGDLHLQTAPMHHSYHHEQHQQHSVQQQSSTVDGGQQQYLSHQVHTTSGLAPQTSPGVHTGTVVSSHGHITGGTGWSRTSSFSGSSDALDSAGTPRFVKDSSRMWYKPDISRDEAINLLREKPPGAFVVRDSHSYPGAFGLAVKVPHLPPGVQMKSNDIQAELVRHFLIEPTSKGVRLKGCSNEPIFGSLAALVYQHTLTPLALPCKLVLPECHDAGHSPGISTQQHHMSSSSGLTPVTPLLSHPSTPNDVLQQGAACNVLFLGSVEVENLTGSNAVGRGVDLLLSSQPAGSMLRTTECQLKVAADGVSLTDNQRKLFFRRHYPISAVSYCGVDPQERNFSSAEVSSRGLQRSLIFGFVVRKSPASADHICHLLAEIDPGQPASAVVKFVSKYVTNSRH